MFNEERKNKILELLELNSKVTVGELGSLFGVSEVTIRKDLNDLCDSGLAVRTHGGAMARMRTRYEPSQAEKVQEAYPQKRAIAERAAQEIKDGETVMLYGGSTTQELARRLKEKSWNDLTVITNALNIANELADAEGINLIIIGGILR